MGAILRGLLTRSLLEVVIAVLISWSFGTRRGRGLNRNPTAFLQAMLGIGRGSLTNYLIRESL